MANARSFVNQGLYLQRETTPGTPATDAMKRYLGIRTTSIGWDIQKTAFTPAGSKVPAGEVVESELGTMAVEAAQDYNGLMPLLAGVFGAPETTPGTEPGTYSHVFSIRPYEADELAAFTSIFGDSTQAVQATNTVFHGMTFGVTRTGLNLTTTALLRAPETGASVPTTGVEDIAMVPTRASTYCAYLDSTWDDLGTSKLMSLYGSDLSFGDKYAADWVVDCDLPSFSQLIENENVDMTQALTLGFDSTAVAQIEDAQNGEFKFVRLEATGPEIGDTGENHLLTIDTCVALTPNNIQRSQVSPATVIDFNGRLMVDPVSGHVAQVTLVNGIESL